MFSNIYTCLFKHMISELITFGLVNLTLVYVFSEKELVKYLLKKLFLTNTCILNLNFVLQYLI